MLELQARVLRREHTSVASFSNDVVRVINSQFGNSASNISELITLVSGRAEDMKQDERDRRTLARRIVKAIEPLLEDAIRKEAELNGRPYAQQIREMDEALLSRRGSLAESMETPGLDSLEPKPPVGIGNFEDGDIEMEDGVDVIDKDRPSLEITTDNNTVIEKPELFKSENLLPGDHVVSANTPPASTNGFKHEQPSNDGLSGIQNPPLEPPTPPMSLEGHVQTLTCQGGIPWYVAQFDPEGTTIFEERWTGPEVLREMSEELSEMDEDELQDLGGAAGDEITDEPRVNGLVSVDDAMDGPTIAVESSALRKKTAGRRGGRRGRSSEWGTKSFRNRR